MRTLSVIVITMNEERCIARCLESVKWANEIIVFDSGSTDNTVEICRTYTPHVFETDWPGYGAQKNRAMAKATCDWVLSVDADEEVTEGLRREIQDCIAQDDYAGYRLPRQNKYCGQYLRYKRWRCIARLVRRGKGSYNDKLVHENLVVNGRVKNLTQPLLHDSVPDLEAVLSKMNRYSTLGAQTRLNRGKSCGFLKPVANGIWFFFNEYLLKGRFLDGAMGFVASVAGAEETYYRYLKLWLLSRDAKSKESGNE